MNPARVCDYSRASGVRVTTDAVSAANVAGYMIAHAEKITYDSDDAFSSLRRHISFIELLVKQSSALLNQLQSLLYLAHPQLVRHAAEGVPQWLLKLLIAYPTAKRLARCQPKTLAQIPFVAFPRAQTLIAEARLSVASASDPAMEMLVTETAREILRLERLINAQKKALSIRTDLPAEAALLASFVGIAEYTAVALLLEIGSPGRRPIQTSSSRIRRPAS